MVPVVPNVSIGSYMIRNVWNILFRRRLILINYHPAILTGRSLRRKQTDFHR